MEFFTAGNLVTLGLVLVLLFVFRQMDKNNRHMGKLRNYSDQLKKDLAAFMEVQESSVKDYAISLNVERESAKELMNRIRQTEAALAEKAAMMSQMDDQIKTYENTLAELHRMTGRVQENLNRLRDESAFVDTTSKRIGEITNKLDTVDKEVASLESKFERENADALEQAAQSLLASVNSKVSDLTATAEVIERNVDDRRQEILRIEQERAGRLVQDEEHINEVLRNAVEQAGKQSDKMEESALLVFRQQAEERIQRLKSAEEGQLKNYEEHAKVRLAEIYAQINSLKDEWQAERLAWESKDKELRDERSSGIQHIDHSLESAEKRLAAIQDTVEATMSQANARMTEALSSQESVLEKTTAEMAQRVLVATEQKLQEYSEAQSLEFTRLQTLADDSRKLDEELRLSMRETTSRVQADFARYEQEAEMLRKQELDKFSVVATALKVEMTELDKELTALKNSAKDNVFEKLKAFESDFTVELAKRNDDIQERILAWQTDLGERLAQMREEALTSYRTMEQKLTEEIQKNLAGKGQQLAATVERLTTDTEAFQSKLNIDMEDFAGSIAALKAQLSVSSTEAKNDIQTLNASLDTSEQRFETARLSFEAEFADISKKTLAVVSSQEALLLKSIEDMKQKALEASSQQLQEYSDAQRVEFSRLEALTDDSRKLDEELRLTMQETIASIKDDFSRYEQEAESLRKAEIDKFSTVAAALQKEMAGINEGIDNLKSIAVDNVSQSIKLFEDGFAADISKRGTEVQERILVWQDKFENQLAHIAEEAETTRRHMEKDLTEEMRKTLSFADERLVASLEHLKTETAAFEDRIRSDMGAADESMVSLKGQLAESVTDAKKEANLFLTAEIGKQSLAAAELVKQYQRDLDDKFRELSDSLTTRKGEIEAILEASRAEVSASGSVLTEKIRELDSNIEDTRRRMKDVSLETDNRIATVRFTVEETERHIKEAVEQAKVLDRADELRLDLGRRIEDLKSDIDRLDQRRSEAAQLENDFVKIKRLEDDVNAKMTRFLSEKRRIEAMEADFNRLLKISQAVEEKLTHVTASDDTLQGIQLQIRKLEEALGSTEDKFQRIERKNQILENTNEGIDKNFRVLQESEKLSIKIEGDLQRYGEGLSTIKTSIEKLSGESEKATDALSKIEMLNTMLEDIEDRINAMHRARKWIADAEGRLEKLNADAQIQARAIDAIVNRKTSAASDLGPGAPPPQIKENAISLAKQGWKIDEIAKALKRTRGEVELILEMEQWDK